MCRSGDILGPRRQAHIFPTKALLATTSFSKACYMQELTCNRRAYEISGLLDIPGMAWLEIHYAITGSRKCRILLIISISALWRHLRVQASGLFAIAMFLSKGLTL
jgi:hypothetical protein